VEFALAIPVFALAMFGLLDVGKFVYTNSVMSQAAREGARLGATEAAWIGVPGDGCVANATLITSTNPGAHVCPANVVAFKSHIVDAVNRMTAGVGTLSSVYISCNAGTVADPAPSGAWTDSVGGNGCDDASGNSIGQSGQLVSVRVEITYDPITPVISSILGSLPLTGSASMVIS
jgi:hypothetical protein